MKTLAALIISLACVLSAQAQVSFHWMTHVLVPGESVQVYLIQPEAQGLTLTQAPVAKNGTIKLQQQGYLPWETSPSGRADALLFTCIPDKEGFLEIEPFTVKDNSGKTFKTPAQKIPVRPFDSITWLPLVINGENNPNGYGVMWYTGTQTPYVNQPITCELKIYAPAALSNFNIPQMQNKGLGVGRFLPYFLRQSVNPSGEALLKGKTWNAYCYGATITPLVPGTVSIGPGTVEANIIQEQVDPMWGQYIRQLVPIPLSIPEHSFESKALPSGAPASFQNAVGRFEMTTSTTATDLVEGEPVSINIRISGKGNLNIMSCPRPSSEENWKLYPATKLTPDPEKTGYLEFQMLMKPLKETNAIPSFVLSYFDPTLNKYVTLNSPEIPLKWKAMELSSPSITGARLAPPPPAGAVPVEEMSDIITGHSTDTWDLTKTRLSTLVARDRTLWPYGLLPAFFIVLYGLYIRAKKRQEETAGQRNNLQKLNDIGRKTNNKDFLRSLGAYVELVVPEEKQSADIKSILKQRDESTYLPHNQEIPLSAQERQSMMQSVRKIVKTLAVLALLLIPAFSITPAQGQTTPPSADLPLLPTARKVKSDDNQAPAIVQAKDEKTGKAEDSKEAANPVIQKVYKPSEEVLALRNQLKVTNDSVRQAQLLLQLGNQEYRENQPGAAALSYRRALQIAPDLYEARRNLGFIERKEGSIQRDITPTEEMLEQVPYFYFSYSLLIFVALFSATVAYMWAFRRYKTSQWFLFGIFLCATAGNIWAIWKYPLTSASISPDKQFIITTNDASAWHDASRGSQKVFTKLPPGSMGRVLAVRGSWLYVELANGVRGWIPTDTGEFLSPPSA